jgi:two-component system response regulator FlrC
LFPEAIIVTAQFENSHPALWLDPKAAVGSAEREQLAAAGLQLLPVTTLDDLRQGLAKARLVVIRLMGDVGLLQEVKKLTQSFGHDVPVLCRVDQGELSLGVEAMRRGAYHVLPTNDWSVDSWREALALTPKRAEVTQRNPQTFVFVDPNSQHLLELARRVAQTEVSALVVGPTGAGKEVLARVLHDASPRRNGPFVALNCAALPEHLIEDLLFGHEKGAFTGALKEHRGLFEQAHGGTIFLDEIAEMPYHLQTKLLRVLQERKITRLGGHGSVELDVRLVAATNKDLREAINNREFREDLYFRISAFKLTILPLRERPGDVLPLATQFLEKFGPADRQVQLTETAIERLQHYSWPGNVRELQNVIQRALVLSNDDLITENELMFDEIEQRHTPQTLPPSTQSHLMQYGPREVSEAHQLNASALGDLSTAVKSSEYQVIMAAIQSTRNRNEAAKKLGISPRSLRYKMAQFRELGMTANAAANSINSMSGMVGMTGMHGMAAA